MASGPQYSSVNTLNPVLTPLFVFFTRRYRPSSFNFLGLKYISNDLCQHLVAKVHL